MDLGKCFVTAFEDRPGQVRNWLLAMAAFHSGRDGTEGCSVEVFQ
jgi:hypothetical protein